MTIDSAPDLQGHTRIPSSLEGGHHTRNFKTHFDSNNNIFSTHYDKLDTI
jgi:hypothetical protein